MGTDSSFSDVSTFLCLIVDFDKHLKDQIVLYLENWGNHGTCNIGNYGEDK